MRTLTAQCVPHDKAGSRRRYAKEQEPCLHYYQKSNPVSDRAR